MFILYLTGDAILATKTALVGFFGEFLLVMLKIAYKEPRPFWIHKDINTFRCFYSSDFEGPSDHMFILMFLGTYINLIYLRKYSRHSQIVLSNSFFVLQFILMISTTWAGLILGHTYVQ